jgi:hypothetical protein
LLFHSTAGCRNVTDRRQGDDIVAEVDEGVSKMQGFVRALELEIKERTVLIELLEHADVFYETQKGEAKVVANVSMASVLTDYNIFLYFKTRFIVPGATN